MLLKKRQGTEPNSGKRHYPDICEALLCHKLSEAMNPEIKVKQIDCLVGPCQTEVSVQLLHVAETSTTRSSVHHHTLPTAAIHLPAE